VIIEWHRKSLSYRALLLLLLLLCSGGWQKYAAFYWSPYFLLQGILARCMQRTSNVPLWRLYAKQECCQGPSSDLEYEREMLVRLILLLL
jgi:hypothetical protein